jgi:SAM-dependent methyltransferase
MGSMEPVEHAVRNFYDRYGWTDGGEDEMFRQFRPAYRPYHAETEKRTLACFDGRAGRLLIVGGGDLPGSHQAVAARFDDISCIDISQAALDIVAAKLPRTHTVLDSICAAPFADGRFDAVFASHVIYHIDAAQQERAVREMIRVVRPGGRIVILYSNPRSPIRFAAGALHRVRRRWRPEKAVNQTGHTLYFAPYRLRWWQRFADSCAVTLQPWDVIGSFEERTLIHSDRLAKAFYGAAGWLEHAAPRLAVQLWQYPIVVLDKKPA